MKHSTFAVLVLAGAALTVNPLQAKQESIAGDWTLSVEHIGLKLVLEQKKSAVTGTLDWPHGDPIKVAGIFADGPAIFSGDLARQNFKNHGDSAGPAQARGPVDRAVKAH